jgi:hypothetical protein
MIACRACRHPRVIDVRPVIDEGALPAALTLGGLPLTARFCRACGDVEWRIPSRSLLPSERAEPCVDCGARSRVPLTPVEEQAGRGWKPLGGKKAPLAARACAQCGLVSWSSLRAPPAGPRGRACASCGNADTRTRRLVDEIRWLRATTFGVDAGHPFEVTTCGDCLAVRFRVDDPGRVRHDGQRIVAVEPVPPGGGGPYRNEPLIMMPVESLAVEPVAPPTTGRNSSCRVHRRLVATSVLDLAGGDIFALALDGQRGRLGAVFCKVCRNVEWCVAADDDFWQQPRREPIGRCPTCRGRTVKLERVVQRVGARYVRALDVRTFPLIAEACTACTRVSWSVTPLWIDLAPGDETCRHCHGKHAVSCAVWDWVTPADAIPLGVVEGTAFRAHACNHCARVDWSLDGAERVQPDGIRLIDIGAAPGLRWE